MLTIAPTSATDLRGYLHQPSSVSVFCTVYVCYQSNVFLVVFYHIFQWYYYLYLSSSRIIYSSFIKQIVFTLFTAFLLLFIKISLYLQLYTQILHLAPLSVLLSACKFICICLQEKRVWLKNVIILNNKLVANLPTTNYEFNLTERIVILLFSKFYATLTHIQTD